MSTRDFLSSDGSILIWRIVLSKSDSLSALCLNNSISGNNCTILFANDLFEDWCDDKFAMLTPFEVNIFDSDIFIHDEQAPGKWHTIGLI